MLPAIQRNTRTLLTTSVSNVVTSVMLATLPSALNAHLTFSSPWIRKVVKSTALRRSFRITQQPRSSVLHVRLPVRLVLMPQNVNHVPPRNSSKTNSAIHPAERIVMSAQMRPPAQPALQDLPSRVMVKPARIPAPMVNSKIISPISVKTVSPPAKLVITPPHARSVPQGDS